MSKVLNVGLTLAGGFAQGGWAGVGMAALGLALGGGQGSVGKLKELSIQTAQEGAQLPRGWGQWRQAGTLVWTPGLIEHPKRKKNQPRQYSYSSRGLIVGGRGPISGVRRIKFNQKVRYDWNEGNPKPGAPQLSGDGTHLVFEGKPTIRLWLGKPDQGVDSMMETVKGVNQWTNYPGLWYLSIDEFDLTTDYGNGFPNITVEPFYDVTDLPSVIAEIGSWCGLTPAHLDLSELVGESVAPTPGEGYVINSRTQGSSAVTELMNLHNFRLPEIDGILTAVRCGRTRVAILTDLDVRASDGGAETPSVARTFPDERQIAHVQEMVFYDPAREGNPGYRYARREEELTLGDDGGKKETVSTSAMVAAARAEQLTKIRLHERHERARTLDLSGTPKHLWLAPSDVVDVELRSGTRTVELPQITLPLFGAWTAPALGYNSLVYDVPLGLGQGALPNASVPSAGTLRFLVINSVAVGREGEIGTDTSAAPGLLVAATLEGGEDWQGAQVKAQGQGNKNVTGAEIDGRAVMGELLQPYQCVGDAGGYQSGASMRVRLYRGALYGAPLADVQSGANVAIFENGCIFSFLSVTRDSQADWTISGIKDGRWGSEYAATLLASGTRFVLLRDNAAKFAPGVVWLSLALRAGEPLQDSVFAIELHAAQEGQDVDTSLNLTYRGRNLEPLSPAAARLTRDEDGSAVLTGRGRTRWMNDEQHSDGPYSLGNGQSGFRYEITLTGNGQTKVLTRDTLDNDGCVRDDFCERRAERVIWRSAGFSFRFNSLMERSIQDLWARRDVRPDQIPRRKLSEKPNHGYFTKQTLPRAPGLRCRLARCRGRSGARCGCRCHINRRQWPRWWRRAQRHRDQCSGRGQQRCFGRTVASSSLMTSRLSSKPRESGHTRPTHRSTGLMRPPASTWYGRSFPTDRSRPMAPRRSKKITASCAAVTVWPVALVYKSHDPGGAGDNVGSLTVKTRVFPNLTSVLAPLSELVGLRDSINGLASRVSALEAR